MSKIWLVIYIFCFLFAPPLIPGINFSFILGGFSLIAILLKYHKRLACIFKRKSFLKFLGFFAAYLILFLCAHLINNFVHGEDVFDNFLLNLYSMFLNFGVTFVCAIYLVFKCEDLGLGKKDLIKLFIYAGLVQFAISMLALINPGFRDFTINLMTKETNERFMNSPWLLERRFYGLSNNLLDLFGFGMGILATLPLFYASAEHKKLYYLAAPLLLLVSILNSRTGILIFIIGFLTWMIGTLIARKVNIVKIVMGAVLLVVISTFGLQLLSHFSPHTMEWIENDVYSFFDPETTNGTATAIYDDDYWTLPEGEQILIGSGHNISGYSSNKVEQQTHTDNGYINEIWKVGLIGLILYLIFNLYFVKQCYINETDVLYKAMYVFFGIAMMIFLIKGSLVGYNPGNVIIYTMFIYAIMHPLRRQDDKK